jgi:Flp pilus assembly protein TadD
MVRGTIAWVLLALAALACTPRQAEIRTSEADRLVREQKYEEARVKYEEAVKLAPDREEIRFKLADTYFQLARKALDEKADEKTYAELLSKAQEEALVGLELSPDSARGHLMLGLVAAYRGDMDAARESFEIARQLEPVNPIHYLNLAEVSVYRGKLSQARRYLERGRRLGAPPAILEVTELLAAWRAGDFVEAEDLFENLKELNPAAVKNQFGEENIDSFEAFTKACCEEVACGPFMKSACAAADQRVTERKLLEETLRQQLALEQERRERVSKVYDRLRELNIDVEEQEAEVPDLGPEPAPVQPPAPGQQRPGPDGNGGRRPGR